VRGVKRLIAPLVLACLVVATLALTAGSDDASPSRVPDLELVRLDGGEPFALASLAGGDAPTLLWFWAPWCSVCNAEAPKIERLARELDVVAIGGRDDVANGPAFVERHALRTPTMLFDESMASWQHYAIPGQPGAILLDTDGVERGRWHGAFDPQLALDAARAL
jgi:thiol-disulfide isomerase/thioredoxin